MINIICGETLSAGNFINVKVAVILANKILKQDDLYRQIAAHPSFDHSDTTPPTIAGFMRNADLTMTLNLYHAINEEKNIDGYDDTEHPENIHLNIWRTNRSPESMCNTIVHACVHAVNALHDHNYFGHGDNSLPGKDNTAPYRIGEMAQRMASKDAAIIIPLAHDPVAPRLKNISRYNTHLAMAQ